jgi:tetratricopeptide (TPR) repeat protein
VSYIKSVFILLLLFAGSNLKGQNTPDAYFNKAYNYLLFDKNQAIIYFDKCLEADNNYVAAYLLRGITKFKLGSYEDALVDFSEALERNEKLAIAYMYKGYTFQQLGQNDLALSSFNAYIENKETGSSLDFRVLGRAKLVEGDHDGAVEAFNKAISENPTESEYYYQFMAYFEAQAYELAIEQINQAIALNSEFYGYYIHRGKSNFLIGNMDAAMTDYSRAIRLSDEVSDSYYLRGLVLDSLEQHNSAITDFSEAIRLNPEDGTYYSKRGNAKFAIGNRESACLDWTVAGNLGYYEEFDKIKTLCNRQ